MTSRMFWCDLDRMDNGYLQPFDGVDVCGSKKGEAGQQPPCHPHDHHLDLKDTLGPQLNGTSLSHFTLGHSTAHGSSLTEVSQRLAAAALRSWMPAPAASKRRKSVPTPVRAFPPGILGPPLADSTTCIFGILGERF